MPGAARRPNRRQPRPGWRASAAALSIATLVSLVWLASVVRPSAWPVATILWIAAAGSALPFVVLVRVSPTRPPQAHGGPRSITTMIWIGDSSPEETRTTMRGVASLGPCVAISNRPIEPDAANALGVPVFVGSTLNAAMSSAAGSITTDAVLVLSDAALPDFVAARRAAGLLEDPEIGWITGAAIPFNRDGYAPTVRQRLDWRLRHECRAEGAALWEHDATIVRTQALRDLSVQPDELWSAWLRRASTHAWRGAATDEVLAVQRLPVTAERYWRQAIRRRRLIVAGLADASRHGPWRARARSSAMLARQLYGWWFGLILVAPALIALQGEFPFAAPSPVVVGALGGLGVLRWAALRRVHAVPLRPGRELLAAAYEAPASILSTPAAVTRRVRDSRVTLPPRPLGWVAGALALVLIATVVQHGGDPSQATVVASALVEMLLLWSFALQGIVQLLRARATFRIPIDLALTIDGHPTRSIDGSPVGLAARVEGSRPAPGASVALTVDLDDGRSLATQARVRHRQPTRDGHAAIVGLELLLPDEQEPVWAAQLARTAVVAGQRTTAVPARPLAPTGTNRWLRAAQTLSVGAVTIALVAVTSVLALPAFGLRSAVVVSASMSPALRTGDLVIVRQIPARQLQVGDIARIDLLGDGGTTHRVVAIDAGTGQVLVTTRGDANTATEQWDLDPDHTVGTVQLHIPWVGRVASRVGTAVPRNAVTVAVVVLAAVVVASALRSRRATGG